MATAAFALIVEKECTQCGRVLPCTSDYFNKNAQQRSGWHPCCKECHKKTQNKYLEKIKNNNREGVTNSLQPAMKICVRCREKLPFTKDFFAVDNHRTSGFRPYCKGCTNKDNKSRIYPPEYRRECRKKYRNGTARFRESIACASKKAIKFGVTNTLVEAEWRSKVESLGFECQICGNTCTLERNKPNSLSLEHVMPLSHGGENTIENVVPACLACNRMKGELTVEEFKVWVCRVQRFLEAKC